MQAHKAGRKAGASARDKHAAKKGKLTDSNSPSMLQGSGEQVQKTLKERAEHSRYGCVGGARTASVHSSGGRLAHSKAERINAAKVHR